MGLEEMNAATLDKILGLIHSLTGISMGASKQTMIQGRLRPRMRALNLPTYESYVEYLVSHKEETQNFINLVTTNETYFFRTQRVWDYFTKDYLPQWTAQNAGKILRIWSGASSSGEEIYTIAICCEEHRRNNAGFNYQILGTDISSEVLAIADKGVYSGRSIEAFRNSSSALFERYMTPVAEGFRVRAEVHGKVKFARHNVFETPSQLKHYDIIFLRNILIYFDGKDQEKVLASVSKGLIDGGKLIIGESESLNSLSVPFRSVLPLVYEKITDHEAKVA